MSIDSSAPRITTQSDCPTTAPTIAICSVELNEYNAPMIAALCNVSSLRVGAIHFSKSHQGDRGAMARIKRLLSYGVGNLARIALQRWRRRGELRRNERERVAAAESAIAQCGARIFRGGDFAASLRAFADMRVDAVVLIYFNRIIPKWFLEQIPRVYNIHPGKLPEFRGVQPVFWTLLHGAAHATIAVHVAEAAVDAGPVLFESEIPIKRATYHDVLLALSDALAPQLAEITRAAIRGELSPRAQNEGAAGYFGRPTAADVRRFLQAGNRYY